MVASRYDALRAMREAAFDERKIVEPPPKPCPECAALRARNALLEAENVTLKRNAVTRNAVTRKGVTRNTVTPSVTPKRNASAERQARYRARKAKDQ